jgi:hypothetical protein
MKKIQNNSKINTFITQTSPSPVADEILLIKQREKKRLIKSLKSMERSLTEAAEIEKKIEASREKRKKNISMKSPKKMIMENFKIKQLENYKRIKRAQEVKSSKYRIRNYTPTLQKNYSIDFYEKETEEYDSDQDLDQRIKKIEEKMKKSEILHEKYLNQKKKAIAKLLEKFPKKSKVASFDNESEKILKLISKHEAFKQRRESLVASKHANSLRSKSEIEKKIASAKNKVKTMQKQNSKDKEYQNKMVKSEMLLKKNRDEWIKKQETRNEFNRQKEESVAIELERKTNIMKYRRDLLIDKQFIDSERIEKITQDREMKIKKKMDVMIKGMIEKEKTNKIIAAAFKSPDYKQIRKKLSELEIMDTN